MTGRVPEIKRTAARAMIAAGIPYRSIAAALSLSTATVGRIAREGVADADPALAAEFKERADELTLPRAPFQKENTGWDKLWQAARIKRRFTLISLAAIAGQSPANVQTWASAYRDAGWLRLCGKATWTFAKNPPVKRPALSEGRTDGLEEAP